MFGSSKPQQDTITYFAETDSRGRRVKFGVKDSDRTKHIYLIGKSGMGKSTLLENLAVQDIQNGNGLCFIDPHGSAVDTFLDYIPEDRIDDVVYFAPFDFEHPVAFNVMEDVAPDKRSLVAQGLLSSFKKIWGEETFSDRMEHIVSNTLLALLEYPGSTMLSISRMFVDIPFQKKVVANITDPIVKQFWTQEYASWSDTYRRDAYSAVLNKIGQFTSNPVIRNIVGQPKSSFDIRQCMDEKKILLVNLSIGQVGESNANLLGSMLTTKVFLAGMSRADLTKPQLAAAPNFYLYIDEFQNLANDSFADILSQSRKYKLNLTLAHQYIEQMPETVRAAVFGNVGTMITFRVGATDAEVFEREFGQAFLAADFVALSRFQIYLSLMIDGAGSPPFSARTLAPLPLPAINFREETIAASRSVYARPRSAVESDIAEWMGQSLSAPKIKPNNGMPDHIKKKREAAKKGATNQGKDTPKKSPDNPRPNNNVVTEEMKADLPGTNDLKSAFAALQLDNNTDSSSSQPTTSEDNTNKQTQGQQKSKKQLTQSDNSDRDVVSSKKEESVKNKEGGGRVEKTRSKTQQSKQKLNRKHGKQSKAAKTSNDLADFIKSATDT